MFTTFRSNILPLSSGWNIKPNKQVAGGYQRERDLLFARLIFCPEVEGSTFVQNVGNLYQTTRRHKIVPFLVIAVRTSNYTNSIRRSA
jgi:hypothetical protein